MSVSKDNKNNDIQVLRAIAIILVLIQHYKWRMPSPDWYVGIFNYVNFWGGVDIFLAISGFLMYGIISKEISRSGRTLKTFFSFISKRFFRLYPALIIWSILSVFAAWYITPDFDTDIGKTIYNIIPTLLSYSNFYWFNCASSAISCGSSDLSGITWSLSLEWQLYISLSIIMLLTRGKAFIMVLISIFILSLLIGYGHGGFKSIAWWTRPHAFILGAILCAANSRFNININKNLRVALLFISIVLICIVPNYAPESTVVLFVGVLGAACLLACINGDLFRDSFLRNILTWIGDRSYSIYLGHFIVMHVIAKSIRTYSEVKFINENTFLALIVYVFALLVTSHLSFKYIEMPFIEIGKSTIKKIVKCKAA